MNIRIQRYLFRPTKRRTAPSRGPLTRIFVTALTLALLSTAARAQQSAHDAADLDAMPRGARLRSPGDAFTQSIDRPGHLDPAFSAAIDQPGDENWDSRFGVPGVDGVVHSIFTLGNDLYIGGLFTSVGGIRADNIARWDGQRWWPLISNDWNGTDGDVLALASYNGRLVVGGQFTIVGGQPINGIAMWDPATRTWSTVGDGIEGDQFAYVAAIAVRGNDMYIGGRFSAAGEALAVNVARWDGSRWHRLGVGMNDWVYSLAFHGTDLYAGGLFTAVGAEPMNHVARWDGTAWRPLGAGANRPVHTFAATADYLYVGGTFDSIGGQSVRALARWKPSTSTWESVPGGVSAGAPSTFVYSLAARGSEVLVGGHFRKAGALDVNHLARFRETGSTWETVAGGVSLDPAHLAPYVSVIHMTPTDVYFGGNFINTLRGFQAQGDLARGVARLHMNRLTAIGGGVNNTIYTIAVDGSDVYVGGSFSSAGGLSALNVARWNTGTERWSVLDSGLPGAILDMAVKGDDIFASNEGTLYRYRKSTGAWTALPFSPGIQALAFHGNDLYVGFGSGIRRWNGKPSVAEWDTLGRGVNGVVHTIVSAGDDIYVGGSFTIAGSDSAYSIARWHVPTSTWHPLGRGIRGEVLAIAVRGTEVYAGGRFTQAGTVDAANIAVWITEDQEWYPLDDGLNHAVWAIATSPTAVYATGQFMRSGDTTLNYIARWTGESWATLGSGIGQAGSLAPGRAIATLGDDVFVGGNFDSAGGRPSFRFGKWNRTTAGVDDGGAVTGATGPLAIQSAAYPNPFQRSARITFDLARAGRTVVEIHDAQGGTITRLAESWRDAGRHELTWEATGLPEGIYFCRITCGAAVTSLPLMLIR